MANPLPFLIAAIASVHGAAGVALAAAAAHTDASPMLATASQFLMIHAGVGLALAALARGLPPLPGLLYSATCALQAGVTLFAGDLAARVFLTGKLFPYAAPLGGGTTILSWALLCAWAIAAIIVSTRDRGPPATH